MFNIDSILSFAFNLLFDIRDSIESGAGESIDSSTIKLVCVADNTLPEKTISEYCKNLEVIYASYIRSILSVSSRTRFNSSAKSIFRGLPLLTPYDKVKFDQKLDSYESAKLALFSNAKSSSAMVSHFAEECRKEFMNIMANRPGVLENNFSLEADAFLKESRGGVPTFVNADLLINAFGKTVEKKISIGVSVVPKLVDKEYLMSFFIKKGKVNVTTGEKESFFGKLKSKLKVNKNRIKSLNIPGMKKKNLVEMFDAVERVDKPFVCILLNNTTASSLEAGGLKVMSPDVLRAIYNKMPVMSIGVLNTHLDKITVSLTRDTTYYTQTLAEFNSEVASYEKELAEIVRNSARF